MKQIGDWYITGKDAVALLLHPDGNRGHLRVRWMEDGYDTIQSFDDALGVSVEWRGLERMGKPMYYCVAFLNGVPAMCVGMDIEEEDNIELFAESIGPVELFEGMVAWLHDGGNDAGDTQEGQA